MQMDNKLFAIYIFVAAGVTYLIRMLPLVLVKKEITNKFFYSFLHYIPYAVLSAMTIPAIFYATSYTISAAIGFAAAVIFAFLEKSLVKVAAFSCLAVLITELAIAYL